ncbi:enterobactin exporter EntS [Caulifigura coniformis]|uniref:Enterobactin exporter EntS n=1 Tax=Caulifigura coniformis TaxID=2527983 RepID=A0A517SD17_9PLAN|nr:MFS transporter [Caulifigura coniformis]QDT54007.1 enterobactin exporter EntS [Caulifigura coniformis]
MNLDEEHSRPVVAPSRLRNFGRALGSRNYRLFFAGQAVSLVGTWMTRMASSWLVFRLSGANANWLLGVVNFAGLAPTFFLGPVAGVFVDRWDRRQVLIATQVLSFVQSVALAIVAFLGEPAEATIWLIAGLNLFQGVINAFDMPARQALLVEMVEKREDLPNAIALNSSLVNGSRLVGPALSGMIIAAVGEAWCFVIDAVSYLGVIVALVAMRIAARPRLHVAASVGRHFVEGVRYAAGFPPIRALLLLIGVVSFATMPQSVLLPVFAAEVLHGGSNTLAFLSASMGLGAFGGALYLASRSTVLGLGKVIIAANLMLGAGLIGFSESTTAWISCVLLVLTGAGMMVQMAAANTLIQTLVDEDKRGRVMSFFGMAFQGTAPFGSLLGGWLAARFGPSAVVLGSGVVVLTAGGAFASQLRRLRRHARPIYVQRGILPDTAAGMNAASELPPVAPT